MTVFRKSEAVPVSPFLKCSKWNSCGWWHWTDHYLVETDAMTSSGFLQLKLNSDVNWAIKLSKNQTKACGKQNNIMQ